jgi:hypothetical protein
MEDTSNQYNLKLRARALLDSSGPIENLIAEETARQQHVLACDARDVESVALWAKIIWRFRAAESRYDWLRETPGRSFPPGAGTPAETPARLLALKVLAARAR